MLERRRKLIQLRGENTPGERLDYLFEDGVLKDMPETHTPDEYDPRKRGWYQQAKAGGTQTWPPVYLFINKPNPDYPGLDPADGFPVRVNRVVQRVEIAAESVLALIKEWLAIFCHITFNRRMAGSHCLDG